MSVSVAKTLDYIKDKAYITQSEVADLLRSRPETVSRWVQGHQKPHAKTEQMLRELEYIVDELADFYEPNDARRWIFARQKHLRGVSPAQLIREGHIDEVIYLINQLRDGVYF